MRNTLTAVAIALAALVLLWQAQARAERELRLGLRTLAARLDGAIALDYGAVSAHAWGSGRIETVRLTPTPDWLAAQGLPAGLVVQLPVLRYQGLKGAAWWPQTVRLSWDTAQVSLPDPWPQAFGGSLQWQAGDGNRWRVDARAQADGAGALEGHLVFQPARPESLRDAALVASEWRYRDLGALQGLRAGDALRLGADPANADAAMAARFVAALGVFGLVPPPDMQTPLRAIAREPLAFTLRLAPASPLTPANLHLYAPQDRAAALGLVIENR